MMKKKVVFIAKTNLNTDGRILNQIKILNSFIPNLNIDFIILENKPTSINLGENVFIHSISTFIRNSNFFRFLTVFEFTLKSYCKLMLLKPQIIHAQDNAIVLPVLLYKMQFSKRARIIYDDHELPNQKLNFQQKIFVYFERQLMKRADTIIFANEERLDFLKNKYDLNESILTSFANLPYYEIDYELSKHEQELIEKLKKVKYTGKRLIIHQGSIKKQRGRDLLAETSKKLDDKSKIILLGVTKNNYEDFLEEYSLDASCFHFIGTVNYFALDKFWELADAAIVMYLPELINDRLCAPNRFYIALKHNIPIYVNKDNPILSKLISKYDSGFFIENFDYQKFLNMNSNSFIHKFHFKEIRDEQIRNFINTYHKLIYSSRHTKLN